MDTRWEELYEDIEPEITNMNYHNGGGCSITDVIEVMKDKGWTICYPADWPDLCSNCKSHIDPGTWHKVFNGNFWGSCEVVPGEGPKGWWGTPGEVYDPIEWNKKMMEKYPQNGTITIEQLDL